jgi:hypothetical protein
MTRTIATLVIVAMALPSALAGSAAASPRGQADGRAALAEYVRALPPGSNVRVDRIDGHTVKGTLLKAGDRTLVVQRRTRLPEPPVEMALDEVARVTLEKRSGLGKAIAIGAAVGVGAAFGVLAIIAGAMIDD